MGFRCLVRDQEVGGSNPLVPTTVVESAIYRDTNARGTLGPGLGGEDTQRIRQRDRGQPRSRGAKNRRKLILELVQQC